MNRLGFLPSFYLRFSISMVSVILCDIMNYGNSSKNRILQNFKEGKKERNLPLKCYRPFYASEVANFSVSSIFGGWFPTTHT
jgi:hypothetical protein